ncbi:flagellar basal-body MS-ring/collar protein FliF [Swingsia samuiensis]|uniref:Flagellar M-ring protein n=1 Tax=Swingsia samuiensis TaxID=1293412 RepID=A0A4Y6UMU3_9PROT|nr:flagellar basal-body MS-ring/collar protein FliF [Swingsia samuiensis]QDH17355.1 flagellar M-ring protein FliF [Swingsia samuiensis]
MKALLTNLKQLGLPRLAALGIVGAIMVVFLGFLAFQGTGSLKTLLYRDLDPREAGEIVEQLNKAHIRYVLQQGGQEIRVSEGDVAPARLLLARNGLPSGGSVGYEIFDKNNNFTATEFEQNINETRALEGELERSIRLIHGVQNARVHLVLRHRELFSAEEQSAQASVLLSLDGGRRLDEENVAAIVNLVAAAVPGLETKNISIIDNHGHVLIRQGDGSVSGKETPDRQRQALEQRLSREVEDMLTAFVGEGHIRVESNITMNNDRVQETQESYDPDQQVLRSQQTKNEKSINTQANSNTSVANNLPNASAGQPQSGNQNSRQELTENYEISKKVRTLIQDQPRISRMSIAVMVDGTMSADGKGKPVWHSLPPEEINRLSALTKSAIGFDAKRGDSVTIMSMKFSHTDEKFFEKKQTFIEKVITNPYFLQFTHLLIFALGVLLISFFIIKPLLKERPTSSINALIPQNNNIVDAEIQSGSERIQVDGVNGTVNASFVKKAINLVESTPEESVAVIRDWIKPQHN